MLALVLCAIASGCRTTRQANQPLVSREVRETLLDKSNTAGKPLRRSEPESVRPLKNVSYNLPSAAGTGLSTNAGQSVGGITNVSYETQELPQDTRRRETQRSVVPPMPAGLNANEYAADELPLEPLEFEPAALQLEEVIQSVQQTYPALISVTFERRIAAGKQLTAQGEFDLTAKAFGIAAPHGFYETYRNGVSLNQPLFQGGYLYSGYKIGDGSFEPWYKERETNEGGEFSLGLGVPLLKDRAIDKRRAALFQANLARQSVEPAIQTQLLEFVRAASQAYWTWVAAGQVINAQRELLENAVARVQQIEARVNAGDLERIARINNDQLIAARETKVIQADRKLQQAAIKLSLFYRTPSGEPIVPDHTRILDDFPDLSPPDSEQLDADIAMAIDASPFIAELDLQLQSVRVEIDNARNMLLPKFDAHVLAAQDVGGAANSKRDKSPFQLEAGFYGEIPIQRREARGKITAASGKISQIEVKRRFVVDKITAAVQDAYSALFAAAERIDRAKTNLELARETLRLGQIQFEAGNISLIDLNIYEKSVTDAQLLLIEGEADYFFSLADYRAALSLAPVSPE